METLQLRSVDDGIEGPWGTIDFVTNFPYAGEYETLLTVSYMADPDPIPDRVIGPKRLTVAPPDKIVIANPALWLGTDLAINTDHDVKLKILANGKTANLDLATTTAERKTTIYDDGGNIVAVSDWLSGQSFMYSGAGLIRAIKRLQTDPAEWAAIPVGLDVFHIRQQYRVSYLRGDGVIVQSPVLGTIDYVATKTAGNNFTLTITPQP